jgi:hypothetical protein
LNVSLARCSARIAIGVAIIVGLGGCLLNTKIVRTQQSLLASKACVAGVGEVAAGTNASLYIQDSRGIVRYSRTGTLLATVGPKKGDWAVDGSGNIYYLRGKNIVKVSAEGRVLHSFAAPNMEPEAVNPANGDILAVYGGSGYTGTGPDPFELFSPTGDAIHRWQSSFSGNVAFDSRGDIVTTGQTGAELATVDPKTGKTVARTPSTFGAPYNVVGSDNRGNIWIGGTNSADIPFTVEKMTLHGGKFVFKTLNSSEESVGGLTVATDGSIFVIRSSYNEPGPTDTGLEELSASGSPEGKFAVCKH